MRPGLVLVAVSGVAVGFLLVFASIHTSPKASSGVAASRPVTIPVRAPAGGTAAAPSSEEARTAALFDRNRGMPSDPDLASEYDDLNATYFKYVLPRSRIRWEEGLSDLGPLIADDFDVLGLTDGTQILINPVVRRDPDQRRRSIVHEMVHVAVWAQDTEHGPVFQDQLRQLSLLGAFKGIVASEEEKDEMLARLRRTRAGLETDERALEADRAALDTTSRTAVDAFNARLRDHQGRIAEYNRLVAQYNLMISYPDGLARDRLQPRADGTLR